nr:hypothetical protein [Tanacetum cinerariifolium]
DIEEDDDAEIIFSYEVQGDQTPPPRDESSDFDSEPEAKEADNEPEAEEADNELEVKEAGESSTARDPQFVGGLAPWALRRDLETSRTEVSLLRSEAKIGKMEREILIMI